MSTNHITDHVESVIESVIGDKLPYPEENFTIEYLEKQTLDMLKTMKKVCKIRAKTDDTVANYVSVIAEWYNKKTKTVKTPDSMVTDITSSVSAINLSPKKKDNFDFLMLNAFLDSYILYINTIGEFNCKLTGKKVRNTNFPSEISENIVKFYIKKNVPPYISPIWNTKVGDLEYNGKKIEVKGFSSNGPLSFGPTESWDELYFVDCMDFKNKKFKIYKIPLSNTAVQLRNIKLTTMNTYGQVADANKRGLLRGAFYEIFYKQLTPLGLCTCVFDGPLTELE